MKYNVLSKPDFKKALLKKEIKTVCLNIKVPKHLKDFCKDKKYFIKTHGCQANYRDSEIYKGYFELLGLKETDILEKADFILINSCAVRQKAEEKVLSELGEIKQLKTKDKNKILILAGCMAQEEKNIRTIINSFNFVDLVLGTHDLNNLVRNLDLIITKNQQIIDVSSSSGCIYEKLPSKRDSKFKAFVNITYGCDKFCSYCIVPFLRGRQRSRSIESILKECKELEKSGYKEITLLGQNVTSYGKDLKDGKSFANLLDKVASLNIPRINFLTSHPFDFDYKIIDVIKKHKNIMRYMHLPIQSGCDSILKLMNRKYTFDEYASIIEETRKKIPDIRFSTDIIVGFPNETKKQNEESLKNIKKINFDGAFTFIYSPREGTTAAKIKDNVPRKEKTERFKKLTNILRESFSKSNQKYIGKTLSVLVDSISKTDKNFLSGYSHENLLINFKGNKDLIGSIVKVKVISEHIYFLKGEIVI